MPVVVPRTNFLCQFSLSLFQLRSNFCKIADPYTLSFASFLMNVQNTCHNLVKKGNGIYIWCRLRRYHFMKLQGFSWDSWRWTVQRATWEVSTCISYFLQLHASSKYFPIQVQLILILLLTLQPKFDYMALPVCYLRCFRTMSILLP